MAGAERRGGGDAVAPGTERLEEEGEEAEARRDV